MARNKIDEDLDISRKELDDIKEAFKKEEFRKLLNNYFEEINDPKNKALFQEELTEFERQRGVDITFINPEPGYVIKSSIDGKKKAFINICSNEKVDKPSSTVSSKDGSPGLNWSIPYLQGQPRDDLDNKNERCMVYDVVFHPDTLYLAKKNNRIKKLVDDIALSAVEDSFNVKLDRKNYNFPNLQYKGYKVATVIRKRRDDYTDHSEEDNLSGCPYPYPPPAEDNKPRVTKPRCNYDGADNNPYTTPRFIMKHRREVEMQEYTYSRDAKFHSAIPSTLVIEIDLPLIRCAADVKLDVEHKSLSLISEKPAKYKLKVNLPYEVEDDTGNAKFDKSKKKLIVTLPVKRCKAHLKDYIREDSGIESDANQNNCSSSEEDIRKNVELLNVNDDFSEERSADESAVVRTSEEIKTKFLNSDVHYCFPLNTVTVKESMLLFRLMVKNIDPQSVSHQFVCASKGVHVKFSSLGSGFFPIHYAFCMKIPGAAVDLTSLNIEVWDNCLKGTLKLDFASGIQITSYFVGTSLENLEEKELSTFEEEIVKGTECLIEDDCKSSPDEILPLNSPEFCEVTNECKENCEKKNNLENSSLFSSSSAKDKPLGSAVKIRTFSESSETPETIVVGRRSILKGSRSLSESHTDDYNTWSSLDSESHEDLIASKKTVRFNEVVSKKIFRANSSILGQKKKNEKKARNRKKAAYERMFSTGSEESETDREEFDSVSELSDVSSDDSSGGTSSSVTTVVPSSKRHRRRGAKNQRKAAATAKHNHLLD